MGVLFEKSFDILILEDSPEDMELYKRHLAATPQVKFNIEEVADVGNAIELVKKESYDCYIVDYNLPDANGMDFVRYLLEEKNVVSDAAAIIFITGQGSEELAAEAFKLGAHEYLTKKGIMDGFLGRSVLNAIERAQLTAKLQHYRDKLEISNRDLSEFAHTAAHDLKAPLRRVLSYGEILQEEADGRLSEEDKKLLGRMRINAKRMHKLVDSLLSFSLIDYENEKKKETDLNALAEGIVRELHPQVSENKARIDIIKLPTVYACPVRMRQLFSNLVLNALKYRREKSPHIVFNSDCNEKFVTISVKDNGQGIAEGMQKEIFRDFKRLHASEDIEGSGLGLSICKKVVELHGGQIWVESKLGEGSTFYFTIENSIAEKH